MIESIVVSSNGHLTALGYYIFIINSVSIVSLVICTLVDMDCVRYSGSIMRQLQISYLTKK